MQRIAQLSDRVGWTCISMLGQVQGVFHIFLRLRRFLFFPRHFKFHLYENGDYSPSFMQKINCTKKTELPTKPFFLQKNIWQIFQSCWLCWLDFNLICSMCPDSFFHSCSDSAAHTRQREKGKGEGMIQYFVAFYFSIAFQGRNTFLLFDVLGWIYDDNSNRSNCN